MPHYTRRLFTLLFTLGFLLVCYRLFYTPSPYASESGASSTDRATMGSSAQPLRLAILEADTPQPATHAKYGGYGGVFTALLAAAAQTLDPPRPLDELVRVTAHDVVNDPGSYPPLEDVDALLVTGSRHTAFDDEDWIRRLVEYTRRAVEGGRVRVVGVCFGHQIVGRAMGAKLGRSDKGWEVAVTEVDLTEEGKGAFQLDKMRIHQMHRDIVFDVPQGASLVGSNDICTVQGIYRPGRYITVQGHPEFTNDIVSEILTNRHKVGVFDDDTFEDGMKRAPIPHDGVAIGKAFLKFIREG